MAKLKAGEKVEQKFIVTIKFTSAEDDERYTAKGIKEDLLSDLEQECGVKVVVKEVKKLPVL